jgi:hypothetical protein
MFARTLTGDRDICGARLLSGTTALGWGTLFRIEHLNVGVRSEFEYLARALRRIVLKGGVIIETEVDA